MKVLRFLFLQLTAIYIVFGTGLFTMNGFDESVFLIPETALIAPERLLTGLVDEGILPIIENDIVELENTPAYEGGVVYMPVEFVNAYFNDGFYWDRDEKTLTYTSVNDVIRMKTDDLTYFVNDDPLTLSIPIREINEGIPYMPLELVKKFSHHDFNFNQELGTLVIDDLALDAHYSKVAPQMKEYAVIRTWKDRKSLVVKKVTEGEELKIYEEDTVWLKVRTHEGLMGYIKKEDMADRVTVVGVERTREIYDYSKRMTFEGGLNLGWHQVYRFSDNNKLNSRLEGVHGLDVISPTWFHIKNENGDISNVADINYTRNAHSKGLQVWALFSNGFDRAMTHEVLKSTSKRQKMIKDLLALSALYEVDGINVDFENVGKEDGENYVQFMKELTPYLKKQGLVVSVDMYVPSSWTAHYGRKEVGEIVDYVMVMAYDEHWSTSPESGSVASIGFVDRGIKKTLEEVPNDKVVLGLPYYTRIWYEKKVDGEIKVSSDAYGMNSGYNVMTENGVEFTWLDDIGQYYGEYSDHEQTYKMWLEEERSIEEKMKVYEQYDLAGVAGWSLVFPKEEVWDVLERYLKK